MDKMTSRLLAGLWTRLPRASVHRLLVKSISTSSPICEPDTQTTNFRLEVIKSAGLSQLHNQTQDLISRTRTPLNFHDGDEEEDKPISIPQKQEAARLESTITEALALYSSKHDTFSIRGDCIDILGVEVSPDLKMARVYWCLPYSLDIGELPHDKLELIVKRMQSILDEKGGKIQALVHTRLRAYYPPKLQWVAAEHVQRDLKRGVSLEKGKKKWKQ